MTNAEKLAKETEFLASIIQESPRWDCDKCPAKKECGKYETNESCHNDLVRWLKQEVEEK